MRDHLNQLFQHYDQLRKREQKRIRRRFLSKTYANDWDHIRRILSTTDRMLESDNANLNIHSFAGKQLAKRYKRIVKDSQTITASSPSDHIHKLRIQCKKFRYLFDFFQAIFPAKEQQEIIVTLKSLQDKLGRFNDICMQQQSLKDYVKENPEASADLILALGALLGDLSKEELAIRDLLASEISSFVNPQVDKIIKTYTKLKTK